MRQEPLRLESATGAGGERILRLTGPLTLTNIFQFQAMVRAETAPVTIIDMSGVPYVDSAGIGSLMGVYVSRQKDGRKLALVGVNERVKNAMTVTQVYDFFTVYPTLSEADAALSQRRNAASGC
jgi:anti-sigma B factor antagonist